MLERRMWNKFLTVAFLAGLLLPMLAMFGSNDTAWIETVEKRKAAAFPDLPKHMTDAARFTRDIEAFVSDRIGFRKNLIALRNRIDLSIFHKPATPLVVLGKNGWLFFDERMSAADFLGLTPLSGETLANLRHDIERRRAWLAERGIAYIFLIAPDKQSIYPEYLPESLKYFSGTTRTEQFLSTMRSSPAASSVLYPAAALRATKASRDVYYQKDTHWNFVGGYVAYGTVLEHLEKVSGFRQPRLPLTPDTLRDPNAPGGFWGGDLAAMLNVSATVPPPPRWPEIDEDTCAKPPFPQEVDMSPTAPQDRVWTCAADVNDQRLVLFADSFGGFLAPFFAASFSRFHIYAGHPSFEELQKYVDSEKPTVVIEEHVERQFW